MIQVKEERKGTKSRSGHPPQERITEDQGGLSVSGVGLYCYQAVTLPYSKKKQKKLLSAKVCERSTSPRWEEAFHYLVRDPRDESLIVKVSASVQTLVMGPPKVTKSDSLEYKHKNQDYVLMYSTCACVCACAAVPQLGPGPRLLDSSPPRGADGAWPGAGPLVQPGGGAARESDPNEGHAEGATNTPPPPFTCSTRTGLHWYLWDDRFVSLHDGWDSRCRVSPSPAGLGHSAGCVPQSSRRCGR